MKVTLDIPMVPPSANELRRKYRNPHVYAMLRENWKSLLFAYARKENFADQRLRAAQTAGPCRAIIHTTQHRRGELDRDNLEASMKPIYDAMQALCFLEDDSPEWLSATVEQQLCGKRERPHTVIEIDLPDAAL